MQKKHIHRVLGLHPVVWISKPNTASHTAKARERVLAGRVVQTALLFRTTELSNIYCLVKVPVRNYDISRWHRSSFGEGGGCVCVCGGGFPTSPLFRPVLSEPDPLPDQPGETAGSADR